MISRYTTHDFMNYTAPVTVLYLPNGSGPSPGGENDGYIWTAKSMDRDDRGRYLFIAFYGDVAMSFASSDGRTANSFEPTSSGGSFMDHDDTNIIWSRASKQWVDIQITGVPWPTPDTNCPRNLSDNGGCSTCRVITTRTSKNGVAWSPDAGCKKCGAPGTPSSPNPTSRCHCTEINESGLIRPDPVADPPELQFYRMRPFYLAESGRLAAHTLQYAASPAEMNAVAKYGYWGPYCSNATTGGFYMCHKGHGYGRMHGPHVMEEWFVSGASQAGPEEPPKFYP